MANTRLKIEAKEDGVYAIIDNSADNSLEPKITRKDLLEAIEKHRVTGIDFEAVNAIFKSDEPLIEKKISEIVVSNARAELCSIDADKDRMNGFVKFAAPEFGGKHLTFDEIMTLIRNYGITFGINEAEVRKLADAKGEKDYSDRILIAQGAPSKNGIDGKLVYNFDASGEQTTPKILKDGTVDYKQVDYFQSVAKGQVLATRTDPDTGSAGTTIFGRPLSFRPGKLAPRFNRGKGTTISDDEKTLSAETSGQLVYSNGNISVSNTLDIKGNVDYETGNIDFDGSVMIKGNVVSGFSVKAAGNIEVRGVVEAATITAIGAVNLFGGVQGGDKAEISGGDVFTKFAQNAKINSKGNVVSNSLMHCEVTCGGSVLLEGDNCNIVGGSVYAADEIRARTIGSPMATKTTIKAGNSPDMMSRFEELRSLYEDGRKSYNQLTEAYESIMKTGNVDTFDDRRKAMLHKLINNRATLREQLVEYESELKQLATVMKRTGGKVTAEKVCHYGVTVSVGNATLILNDDVTVSNFINEDGQVRVRAIVY